MEKHTYFKKVLKGVIYSLIISIILVFLLSILMTFVDISGQVTSILYIIITCLSVFLGTIYSAKTINRKGWIVGLLVGTGYMLGLCLIYLILNKSLDFNSKDAIRILLAMLVGAFSGMIGVNV